MNKAIYLTAFLGLLLTACKKNEYDDNTGVGGTISRAVFVEENKPIWQLDFEDNFDGTSINEKDWGIYDDSQNQEIRNHVGQPYEQFPRRKENVKVNNNTAKFYARKNNYMITTGGMGLRRNDLYGRFMTNIRVGGALNLVSGVALTWPESEIWPKDGEVDFYETLYSHYNWMSWAHWGMQVNNNHPKISHTYDFNPSQWHTVIYEWNPDTLKFYVDGMLRWTVDKTNYPEAIPQKNHHLALQADAKSLKDANDSFVVNRDESWLEVDYARFYKRWIMVRQLAGSENSRASISVEKNEIKISNGTNSCRTNNALYTAVYVEQGKSYDVSATISTSGGVSNSWVELFLGDTQPWPNNDYNTGKIYGVDTWKGCFTTPLNGVSMQSLSCNPSRSNGVFTAPKTGIMYFVLKFGSWDGYIQDLRITNISFKKR